LNFVAGLALIAAGVWQSINTLMSERWENRLPRFVALQAYTDHRYAKLVDLVAGILMMVIGILVLFGFFGSGGYSPTFPRRMMR
jgi:uncharacterized membrane protein HdeD (DUF308 family)